ncbi:MAG: hypothetical protein KIS81_05610 [Maricaulaceae bacterium]|nr:hypothetical protein [Maricaulaceae bacterium]
MGDTPPRKRLQWGCWALVVALAAYLAPVIPVERQTVRFLTPEEAESGVEPDQPPPETEWLSLSAWPSTALILAAHHQQSFFSGYDFEGGGDAANRARALLLLSRITGVPGRFGDRLRREGKAHLLFQAERYDAAAERFLALGREDAGGVGEYRQRTAWAYAVDALERAGRLDEAIRAADEATAWFDAPFYTSYFNAMAASGLLAHGELDRAAERARLALDADLGDHPLSRIDRLHLLADIHHQRYLASGSEADADAASALFEEAGAAYTPPKPEADGYIDPFAFRDTVWVIMAPVRLLNDLSRCEEVVTRIDRALAAIPEDTEVQYCHSARGRYSSENFQRAESRCHVLSQAGRPEADEACEIARLRLTEICEPRELAREMVWRDPPEPLSCFTAPAPDEE